MRKMLGWRVGGIALAVPMFLPNPYHADVRIAEIEGPAGPLGAVSLNVETFRILVRWDQSLSGAGGLRSYHPLAFSTARAQPSHVNNALILARSSFALSSARW